MGQGVRLRPGPLLHHSGMGSRSPVIAVLSGVVLALGVAQVVRAAASGANALAWIIGVAFIIAGAGRLYLWFRG